jgi:hypothetical protein
MNSWKLGSFSILNLALAVSFLLTSLDAFAQATVTTLTWAGSDQTGYINSGFQGGNTYTTAKFRFQAGIALDPSGTRLFIADYANNAIRMVNNLGDTSASYTATAYTNKNGISHPLAVAVDAATNIYVLNYGNRTDGSLVVFNGNYYINYNLRTVIATNATHLTNAAAMTLDGFNNAYITVKSNTVIRVTPAGVTTIVGVITHAGTSLRGIAYLASGKLAIADAGNNGIWLMDPSNTNIFANAVKFTGFNGTGDVLGPLEYAAFNHPENVIQAGNGVLVVADCNNNKVKAVDASGTVTRIYGVNSTYWGNVANLVTQGWDDGTVNTTEALDTVQARKPYGLALARNGTLYVTEVYYDILREVTGTGLTPPPPPPPVAPALTLNAGYGQVTLNWAMVNSATNYNVKRSTTNGMEITIFSTSGTNYTDVNVLDGTTYYYVVSAINSTGEGQNSAEQSGKPLYSPTPTDLTVTATNFGSISLAWAPSAGATSYNIKRSTSTSTETTVASTTSLIYNDTGLVNGETYFYVVSAVNPGGENHTNSAEVSATVPIPPPPSPTIGWFDFEGLPIPLSVFHAVSGTAFITHNDLNFAILPNASGVNTKYTTDGSNPTNGSTPYSYQDGWPSNTTYTTPLPITPAPDLLIKAVNTNAGGSSAIVTAEFLFQTGDPIINGNNASLFTISDITAGADLYYTIDGSAPSSTNTTAIHLGTVPATTNVWTVSLNIQSNTLFKVIAYRNNYQASAIASSLFNMTNFQAATISFGFAAGEASSDFVASPGQTFYAPVTLTVLSGTVMDSLQFNLSVTNGGPNPGPSVLPGAYGFASMLMQSIPPPTNFPAGVQLYKPIPPFMFIANAVNPPSPSQITNYNGEAFINLEVADTNNNLLAVGWLERYTQTNLFNTLSQDLIQYSQAHDTTFMQANGKVIVGGYSFAVPPTATNGQTYQIQIGRASATTDGIGGPGSSVYIATPTSGSLSNGAVNAIKNVTLGQRKYLVGDVYPFRWFNAGDFGSGDLVTNGSANAAQVFEAAVYNINSPAFQAPGSDFFDAMDSCGSFGALDTNPADSNYGYFTNAGTLTVPQLNGLFTGDYTTMNQMAFGDGQLDVCDVYVTFLRSEFPSLTWFTRFWNNGVRVADTTTHVNPQSHLASKTQTALAASGAAVKPNLAVASTTAPQVNFAATDVQGTPGQAQQISIPITANIIGNYPVRALMLNLNVVPLDGSPALTTPVSFTPNPALGQPTSGFTKSHGNGNYAAAWLPTNGIAGTAGLSNNVTLGTLTVTIPASVTANSAYAVHFDHASASPNGVASFPKQTLTGLVTLSSRTNSTYGDGIPDVWRLRWFGTVNNYLSLSNACPSGDGVINYLKFVAGVDPNTANDFPCLKPKTPKPSGYSAIHWPTVSGKQYVIESSASLFSGSWSAIATNTGTGTDMEFDDATGGAVKFYRVRILLP